MNEAFLVSFGGTFGNHISKGREFLPLITSEEQLFRVTDAAIQFFADHANAGERFKFTKVPQNDTRNASFTSHASTGQDFAHLPQSRRK